MTTRKASGPIRCIALRAMIREQSINIENCDRHRDLVSGSIYRGDHIDTLNELIGETDKANSYHWRTWFYPLEYKDE